MTVIEIPKVAVAVGTSLILSLMFIPLTTIILYNINRISFLKNIQNERYRLKIILNLYKVIVEFICLILIMPCIYDIIINFNNKNVLQWNSTSYVLLQWAISLTASMYIYESISLGIRETNISKIKLDFAHWLHHFCHVLLLISPFVFNLTYFDLRIAAIYSFWTYFASIPLTACIMRYFTTNSLKQKYILCIITAYLFAFGNIIRCSTGLIGYFLWFNDLSVAIKISFPPFVVLWSIDQVFTSMVLNKMANKYKDYDIPQNQSAPTDTDIDQTTQITIQPNFDIQMSRSIIEISGDI